MTSRLSEMQARFQQKQIQEKEEKLLRLYEHQQQRAFEKVGGRNSAGSNSSIGSTGCGKVRQMFDERRQREGIDRSYPLEPLKSTSVIDGQFRSGSLEKLNNITGSDLVKSTAHKRNNRPKKEISETSSKLQYNNSVQTYEEHTRKEETMYNHRLQTDEKLNSAKEKLSSKYTTKDSQEKKGTMKNVTLGMTFRKDSKPVTKRTVRPAVPALDRNLTPSVHSQPSKTVSSTITAHQRSASQTMEPGKLPGSKQTPPRKPPSSVPPQSAKSPSALRPSSKQPVKSASTRDELTDCKYCNRRFAADRLEVHESICGKTAKKKRKVYDATKHRVEGTELEQYVKRGTKNVSSKPNKPASKKDWRKTHEEFISTIRAAKQAQEHLAKGGKLSDLPPPPPSSNPDYVQCPHCGRKFNESAAERHIPKCASFQFNKPKQGASPLKTKTASGRGFK